MQNVIFCLLLKILRKYHKQLTEQLIEYSIKNRNIINALKNCHYLRYIKELQVKPQRFVLGTC